ncbi:MAG: enoyl-CoA hydratase [Methylophaga sp.]|nr:enoyl-CoA hydratase [Methylophaga sp.]
MEAIAQHIGSYEYFHDSATEQYSQLKTHYDAKYKIGWLLMNSAPRPCFTPTLLAELSSYIQTVKEDMKQTKNDKYDFIVLDSNIDGVFNLGGDLGLFSSLIQKKDRDGLLEYAMSCIDVIYENIAHLHVPATTVSLVKGDALGGGFEAALASNLLIAERGTKLGLPEVLFNLFPGMGAFSLLSRKVGAATAEKIILSGQLYTAEEMFEMGIVDILADEGQADLALFKYIEAVNKRPNSHEALRKVKDICNPISYKELADITHIWVDTALQLTEKDLRMMTRLVKRQTAKAEK